VLVSLVCWSLRRLLELVVCGGGRNGSRLKQHGVTASGEIGHQDPLVAINDALSQFAADKIVLVTEDHHNWKEHGIHENVQQYGLPLRHLTVPHDLAL
jgi:hypothetical protein